MAKKKVELWKIGTGGFLLFSGIHFAGKVQEAIPSPITPIDFVVMLGLVAAGGTLLGDGVGLL